MFNCIVENSGLQYEWLMCLICNSSMSCYAETLEPPIYSYVSAKMFLKKVLYVLNYQGKNKNWDTVEVVGLCSNCSVIRVGSKKSDLRN